MQPNRSRAIPLRFGAFEVDTEAGELRKNGLKVPLQEQPFRVLMLLVENSGKVVTREELQQRLWPADTFVEFDRGLNTAISKVREALGDSATGPRFVETVPRRGYRFLAPVECLGGAEIQETVPASPRELSSVQSALIPIARFFRKNALSAILLIVVVALVWRDFSRPEKNADGPLRKFGFTSEDAVDSGLASYGRAVISPDGGRVAYLTGLGSVRKLWVWMLDRDTHRPYVGIDAGQGPLQKYGYPFWSPDAKYLGFITASEVRKVSVDTGVTSTITEHLGFSRGATWEPAGDSIVLSGGDSLCRLYAVPSRGGAAKLLIQPTESDRNKDFVTPSFLSSHDSSRFLLYSLGEQKPEIILQDLQSGRRSLIGSGAWPVYSPTGHILYQKTIFGRGIWAVPFSIKSMKCTGEPFPVAENGIYPSVARDGTLAYLEEFPRSKKLVWRNRAGLELGDIGQPAKDMFLPSLSPDGRLVGVEGVEPNTGEDVWIHGTDSPVKTRITTDPARDSRAIWSPDGSQIAYFSTRNGIAEIYIVSAEPGGRSRPLLVGGKAVEGMPDDWSPNGKYLVYMGNRRGLMYVERNEHGDWQFPSSPHKEPSSEETASRFSPDSRFVAYCSDESGRPEIYVRTFPGGEKKWQISREGGTQPRWRKDGRELYYVRQDTLVAVPVSIKPTFGTGIAVSLFSSPALEWEYWHPTYDVSADGKRFIMIEPRGQLRKATIRIVQNWIAEFRGRTTGN